MLIASQVDTVAALFARRVELSGPHEAYRVKRDGRWIPTTWDAFREQVLAGAAGLHGAGLERGGSVAIMGDTCPEWCVADLINSRCTTR